MKTPDSSPLVILVRDLLLGSKVFAAAKAAGLPYATVRDPARLAGVVGNCLILDLNLEGAIAAAASWKSASPDRHVIGFVSHVDVETVRHAREVGIDRVMARGRFFQMLPELLDEPKMTAGDEDLSE